MKLISLLLVLTIAVMGCATTQPQRHAYGEPLVVAIDTVPDTPPPPPGLTTGQLIGTIVLVTLLVPVFVLAYAASGSYHGWYGSRTYTSTVKYESGRVTTYKTTITGHHSTTTVRSSHR